MAIDYPNLIARKFADQTHSYSWRDTILYALGIGLGSNPVHPFELRFVYEKGLRALPTMAVVLGHPGFWVSEALRGLNCRFSAPVFPGEPLRTDMWVEPAGTLFRCTALERDKVVLERGLAVFN